MRPASPGLSGIDGPRITIWDQASRYAIFRYPQWTVETLRKQLGRSCAPSGARSMTEPVKDLFSRPTWSGRRARAAQATQ